MLKWLQLYRGNPGAGFTALRHKLSRSVAARRRKEIQTGVRTERIEREGFVEGFC